MSGRVLIVDDDEHILRALATSLTRAGFLVTSADDAVPAIAMSDTNEFDLLVVDFHMKTKTGADVVRHYKARHGRLIYCVVLSGEDDDETRTKCFDAGADEVLLKPTSPMALRKRLAEAVRMLREVAA
jgi:DNA-binding response OmpR family regulator